jgi:GNAT superfamily N-acetyltransferase
MRNSLILSMGSTKMTNFSTMWFKNGIAAVKLAHIVDGKVMLSNLYSRVPGKGYGTDVMKKAVEYADKNGLTIVLVVGRYAYPDGRGLDNDQLVEFYKKFGFTVAEDGQRPIMMDRKPSQEKQVL